MIIRSYANGFEITDWTEELLIIPNKWGLIQQLGIFGESEGVTQHTVTFEEIDKTLGLIGDRVRGERANVNTDYTRKVRSYAVPHFPLDDYISPNDIQGKRAYGTENAEAMEFVRARKLERIRYAHAITLEFARAQLLTTGTVYAPNNTVTYDLYADFGVTRYDVDYTFGTSTADIIGAGEKAIAHIQDNLLSGEVATNIIALCSPTFFSNLIKHPKISTAFQYYTTVGAQQPLRERLGVPNLDGRYRHFDFGGIMYIEYRGIYNGQQLIPDGYAFALPMGTMDMFKTYVSPANKFDLVNTVGQESYFFEYPDNKGEKIEIQTESNFINMVRRPGALVRLLSSN